MVAERPAEPTRGRGAPGVDLEVLRTLRDRHGMSYPRGRVIVREGESSRELYIVLQGAVEFSAQDRATGQRRVLGTAEPGDFFGEVACFVGVPRTATATALVDGTVLLLFDQSSAVELLRASPRFALGVVRRIAERMQEAHQQLRTVKEEAAVLRARLTAAGHPPAAAATPRQDPTRPG